MGRDGPFTDRRSCGCSASRIARIGVGLQQQRARFRRHVVRLTPAGVNFNLHNARRSASEVLLLRRRLLPLWSPESPPRRLADSIAMAAAVLSTLLAGRAKARFAAGAPRTDSSVFCRAVFRPPFLARLSYLCDLQTGSRPFLSSLTGTFYVQLHAPTHILPSASALAHSAMTLALLVVRAPISPQLCFSCHLDKLLIQIRSLLTLRYLSK